MDRHRAWITKLQDHLKCLNHENAPSPKIAWIARLPRSSKCLETNAVLDKLPNVPGTTHCLDYNPVCVTTPVRSQPQVRHHPGFNHNLHDYNLCLANSVGSPTCLDHEIPWITTKLLESLKHVWDTEFPISPNCLDDQSAWIIQLHGSPMCLDQQLVGASTCLDHQLCPDRQLAWNTTVPGRQA